MLSRWLSEEDYRCRHCGLLPPDFEMVDRPMIYEILFGYYDDLCDDYGGKIPVSSGFRCWANRQSQTALDAHLFAALDITQPSADAIEKLFDHIREKYSFLRVGKNLSNCHVHIDCNYLVRPRPVPQYVQGAWWDET